MNVAAEESRLRRGVVLLALHAQYPLTLAERALELQVRAFYVGTSADRNLARDLAYLEESGRILRNEDEIDGVPIRTWKLTPAGVRLAEGTETDPGVEISR